MYRGGVQTSRFVAAESGHNGQSGASVQMAVMTVSDAELVSVRPEAAREMTKRRRVVLPKTAKVCKIEISIIRIVYL